MSLVLEGSTDFILAWISVSLSFFFSKESAIRTNKIY